MESYRMLNHTIILSIAEENSKPEDVEKYAKVLEEFLGDRKNTAHPDYYDAKQHLSSCYNYLTQNEQLNKETNEDKYSKSFTRRLRIPIEELEEKLRNLSYQNLTEDKLEGALIYLADDVGTTPYNLKKYYESIKAVEDREEFLTTTKIELQEIIRLEGSNLKIRDFLPATIATETLAFADNLKVSPEACLTALITALSVCNAVGTQLEIRPSQGFIVSPYLFSMIVAESGSMKSPILRMFAKQPIEYVQKGFIEAYKQSLAQYEEDISRWDSMIPEERESEYPEGKPRIPDRPRLIYIGDKSIEGMNLQFDRYPKQALLYMKDEIAGLFNDADKYKSGKGSENTDIMSMFDGTAPPVIRADRGLVSNPGTVGLSIFGTIQPEILENFWSDIVDPDGYWSRFLYCYQAKSLKFLPDEQGGEESILPGLLASLFRTVSELPAVSYQLNDDGYKSYQVWYNFLAKKGHSEVHPAISKAYSKALGVTGRLILNLHILNEICSGNAIHPRQVIPLSTVVKGINLMEFYLEQRMLLMKKLCNQDSISPQLKAIIECSKKIGWITARDVKRNNWHLRDVDTNTIRSWFQELISLGYGTSEGKGNRLKYTVEE